MPDVAPVMTTTLPRMFGSNICLSYDGLAIMEVWMAEILASRYGRNRRNKGPIDTRHSTLYGFNIAIVESSRFLRPNGGVRG
jgi:hypothetical protein